MATLTIIYWRDIPSQITVKAGRRTAKRQLADRFQEAIDIAAMRAGAHGTEDYLADWHRGEPAACGDDLEQEVAKAQSDIEALYDDNKLMVLIEGKGISNV